MDTKGTIEEQSLGDGKIFDVILMCCVMVDDGCKPGEVKVTVGDVDAADVQTIGSGNLVTDKFSAASKIWVKAVENGGGDQAKNKMYAGMQYQPGTEDGSATTEGYWLFKLE